MLKVVREITMNYVDFLVEADSEEMAIKNYENGIQIDVSPVYVKMLDMKVRDLDDKDLSDPVVKNALKKLNKEDEILEIPETAAKSKATKVSKVSKPRKIKKTENLLERLLNDAQ